MTPKTDSESLKNNKTNWPEDQAGGKNYVVAKKKDNITKLFEMYQECEKDILEKTSDKCDEVINKYKELATEINRVFI